MQELQVYLPQNTPRQFLEDELQQNKEEDTEYTK